VQREFGFTMSNETSLSSLVSNTPKERTKKCYRLTLQEKKRVIELIDDHMHLSRPQLAQLASWKFQKSISPDTISQVVKNRSDILSGPDHGRRLRPYIVQKFESELITEIARLPGDTKISAEFAQNLAIEIRTRPAYENSVLNKYTFSPVWWRSFRLRHGWDSRIIGRHLRARHVEKSALSIITAERDEDEEIQEIQVKDEYTPDDGQIQEIDIKQEYVPSEVAEMQAGPSYQCDKLPNQK